MVSKKIETALNKQIESEGMSSQIYLAIASWAEVRGYSGVAEFLYRHSDEERIHMLKLIRYLNERGGHGIVPSLKQPPGTFESLNEIFKDILDHEMKVSNEINQILEVCLREKDYTTHNFMQWYVSEQIEEEKIFRKILDRLNLIGTDKGGLYLFDRDMESYTGAEGSQQQANGKQ